MGKKSEKVQSKSKIESHTEIGGVLAKGSKFEGYLMTLPGQYTVGRNIVEFDLPTDTKAISVWVTEGGPHFGDAIFLTESVQLRYEAYSARCRVAFSIEWSETAPLTAQANIIRCY